MEELGNKNGYDFTGYRKMYACKKQIRIVYSVINDLLLVPIIAIGKRPRLTALTKRRRTLVLSKYVTSCRLHERKLFKTPLWRLAHPYVKKNDKRICSYFSHPLVNNLLYKTKIHLIIIFHKNFLTIRIFYVILYVLEVRKIWNQN